MPRQPTTSDAFNAVAEPRRRLLIDVLARESAAYRQGMPVNDLVRHSRLPQPTVSKHLGVLRAVGLVKVHTRGRQRNYSLNAEPLRAVHAWVESFERFWDEHLDAIKKFAEQAARQQEKK
jgi:DNA-binding transcriptional ArsR family regulator